MAIKEFRYKGKPIDELRKLSVKEFAQLVPSRQRRSLIRGFTPSQKLLLEKIRKNMKVGKGKPIKTHCRNMVIIPELVGVTLSVHNGKDFFTLSITDEMLGHYIGEFSLTRKKVQHSAPGIGATKSSSAISVK